MNLQPYFFYLFESERSIIDNFQYKMKILDTAICWCSTKCMFLKIMLNSQGNYRVRLTASDRF